MDIVERLKKRKEIIIAANPNGVITQVDRDAIEAADEIERLREALQKIVDAEIYDFNIYDAANNNAPVEPRGIKRFVDARDVVNLVEIARSVLQQKDSD